MPKLTSKAAKVVEAAEAVHGGGSFEPLKPGKYLAQLSEVSVNDQADKYGAASWTAEFRNLISVDTKQSAPGRQWYRITLPLDPSKVPSNYEKDADKWEKYQAMVQGRLKAFFEAFGYTVDSDTDEMLGEWAVITLGIRTIQSGPRQGEKANVVNDVESYEEYGDLDDFGVDEVDDDEAF